LRNHGADRGGLGEDRRQISLGPNCIGKVERIKGFFRNCTCWPG
jgi:hypothetical protein